MDYEDKESPFQPGFPVSPDYFMGRKKIVDKILRYVPKVYKGNPQHYFITGKKGMGKTSLAKYVQNLSNDKLLEVYISNKGNDSLEILTNQIIEGILSKIPKNSALEKAKNIFGSIDNLEFNGAKVNFKPKSELSKDIINDFAYYLNKFYKDLPNNKGIFLVIDDINGLSESENFVNWYKRLSDTIAVERFNLKLYVLFAGYPEKFDNLMNIEPSFSRIFHYEEIGSLDNTEVEKFFTETFKKVNIHCKNEALNLFTLFSSGLPLVMQNIGDYAFWAAEDNEISENIAIESIINAGNEIGSKQLKTILKQIKNDLYEQILLKLGKYHFFSFNKTDFIDKLNDDEKSILDDFLEYMLDLGILISYDSENNEIYEFTNQLYCTYFMIKSLEN